MEVPAVVFKHLSIWGGNRRFATLCDLRPENLVGLGLERLVHSESLAEVISALKQLSLGRINFDNPCRVTILSNRQVRLKVDIMVMPLNEPSDTWLALVINH